MKSKNMLLTVVILAIMSIIFSSCYRDKIRFDENRAKQQIIPIDTAKIFQKNFLASHERFTKFATDTSFFAKHLNMPNAETFNRDIISLLLNQNGADGIRIYYGEDEKGQVRLVLLPVDAKGNDIINDLRSTSAIKIPGISSAYAQTGGGAGENGQGCPPCQIGGNH
ncbi:MAG TPA: hypothetical protein VKT28_17490 [Puia sp.]|nr:hypothetical protein [Puia sp.]